MTLIDEVRRTRAVPAPGLALAIRRAAGVSQTRMARELGVHRVTLARWESGQRTPSGPAAQAYAQLLRDLQSIGPD